jgi:hypothetical protein
MLIYDVLNIFFIVFHTIFILFAIGGWAFKKTRKLNAIILLLTGFSWFFLGIWYGLGYCPCTDWHWQVRVKLGHFDMPESYVKFLIKYITGIDLSAKLVDAITLSLFLICLIVSVLLNYKDVKKDMG